MQLYVRGFFPIERVLEIGGENVRFRAAVSGARIARKTALQQAGHRIIALSRTHEAILLHPLERAKFPILRGDS
jgi:hypothetical protein